MLRESFTFERANFVCVRKGQRNVVVAVEQALLAKRLDVEAIRVLTIGRVHRLRFEIDRQLESRKRVRRMEQPVDLFFAKSDRKETVLEAIVVEDVGERRRDQRAKAVIQKRPRRVLARAATAEIPARKKDRRALIARLIQHEIGIAPTFGRVLSGLAVVQITPFVEQVRTEARPLDRLQKLLRDDRVRVDVGAIERRNDSGVNSKRFHRVANLTA